MVDVIDLLSDDEDESPNNTARSALESFGARKEKRSTASRGAWEDEGDEESPDKAARSALDRFAPRKDRASVVNGEKTIGRGHETAYGAVSPNETARSALSSFLPRKERQSGNATLTNGVGKQKASVNGGHQAVSAKASGGLSSPALARPKVDRGPTMHPPQRQTPLADSGKRHLSRSDRNINGSTAQPEQGSLVALLQQAQAPTSTKALEKQVQSTSSAATPAPFNSNELDERNRRANAYYEEYRKHKESDRLNTSNTPSNARPNRVHIHNLNQVEDGPRFSFPTGWSPSQKQAIRRKTPPLEIVDLLKKNERETLESDAERPAKRPRLLRRVLSNSARPVELSTEDEVERSATPSKPYSVSPQLRKVVSQQVEDAAPAQDQYRAPTERRAKRPRLLRQVFDSSVQSVELSPAASEEKTVTPVKAKDVDVLAEDAAPIKDQYRAPTAVMQNGNDASATPTKSDFVSPQIKETVPSLFQQITPIALRKPPALPQSAKSSISSGKKRTKPFHVLHKTHRLKPSTSQDVLPERMDQPSTKQAQQPTDASKQDLKPPDELSAAVKTVEHHASAEDASRLSILEPVSEPQPELQPVRQAPNGGSSNFGIPYTPEEDALLAELKEERNLRWEDMLQYFKGRTKGSLQVRYSSKVSKRHQQPREKAAVAKPSRPSLLLPEEEEASDSAGGRRQRKKRNNDVSAVSGMISWAEVSRRRQMVEEESVESEIIIAQPISHASAQFQHERAHPRSMARVLRQRELGIGGGRYGGASKAVPDESKEHVFDDIGPLKYHKGTSGDVTCLAWSADGVHFAAGSIAISDERSMQYNRPGNLIVGNCKEGRLYELPEHHLPRPAIAAEGNVNGLHAMRETQDPRLFMTVATVQFSPDGQTLYSAGTDSKVRAYDVGKQTVCAYEIEHKAPLDLLSASNFNVLATACHSSADGSIGIYRGQNHVLALSPSRLEQQTSRAIYPSALRWGMSHHHSNLLLAGFSIDSIDEERDIAGETCLWDVGAERRTQLPVTRNVFDVAWNPRPTSTSTAFAVASTPGSQKVTKGTRTVIQCFAPNQGRVSRVLEWESPAFDINDVIYCQHDDNLIAAGATDGKMYVWDQRFAGRRPTPLHILEHGDSLNVLDHDRTREIADTGVRFLSWGATSSRLYTGSSDGVVKIWNPYMATENAHIQDVATFGSAVMSGAFSPDYRDLLIGEDQGRINLLSIGHGEKAVRSMRKFDFVSAPAHQRRDDPYGAAHELTQSQQIVFRPMGDLPVRQAVQGSKYAGPRLMPTAEEAERVRQNYEMALHAQSDAHARAGMLDSDDESLLQAVRDAGQRALQAGEIIEKLQSRREDATKLYPQAFANQYALHKAEKQRLKLEASLSHQLECCKLDCNYLPANVDEDGEVADSGRSDGRIPGNLRALPSRDTTLLTSEEIIELGLSFKCISCSGPAAKPRSGLPLCEVCAIARRGLTAKCAECSAPIKAGSQRCERCSFACFRCGETATVTEDKRNIICKACKANWKVGVLGYELVLIPSKKPFNSRRPISNANEGGLEFGEDEMERLAARWGTS